MFDEEFLGIAMNIFKLPPLKAIQTSTRFEILFYFLVPLLQPDIDLNFILGSNNFYRIMILRIIYSVIKINTVLIHIKMFLYNCYITLS